MTQNNTESVSPQPGSKFRLPRIGCITLFILAFLYVCISLVFLYRTAFPRKIDCETPTEHVTVYDPCKVLREEDRDALTKLANEVAEAGNCDVALLFVNEDYASFQLIFDAVLNDWETPKGVLLMYGLDGYSLKMGLKGGEWRLSGHDEESLRKSLNEHVYFNRSGSAKILLDDLKRSIEKANQGERTGTVKEDYSGVYFNSKEYSDDYSRVTAVLSLILGLIVFLFGLVVMLSSKDSRRKHLAEAPAILAEFERRHPNEPLLRLEDRNAYVRRGSFLKHPALQLLAVALGVFLAYKVMTRETTFLPDGGSVEDVYKQPDIPDKAPDHLLDLADVFSTDEENALAETIDHLEQNAGGQVRILTVKQLDGIPLESCTLEVASKWKLGEAGKDNGALLFLAVKDRKNRIEVGYGWEGILNDARCGDLLRDAVPELRDERYADACAKIIRGMESYLAGGSGSDAGQVRTVSSVMVVPQIALPEPSRDPRRRNAADAVLGLLGAFGSILGILCFYFGMIIYSTYPSYEIIDPTKPKPQKTPGTSGSGRTSGHRFGSSRSGSSRSRSSRSGGSSRSSRGGGGSFGGGGASGGW